MEVWKVNDRLGTLAKEKKKEDVTGFEETVKREEDRTGITSEKKDTSPQKVKSNAFVSQSGFESTKNADDFINTNSPFAGYRITSKTGARNTGIAGASTNHKGIDRAVPKGTELSLPIDVSFYKSGTDSARGNWIEFKDSAGNILHYQHLQDFGNFKSGQSIPAGTVFARSGNSGVGSGAHLHEEYYSPNGVNITESYWNRYAGSDSSGAEPIPYTVFHKTGFDTPTGKNIFNSTTNSIAQKGYGPFSESVKNATPFERYMMVRQNREKALKDSEEEKENVLEKYGILPAKDTRPLYIKPLDNLLNKESEYFGEKETKKKDTYLEKQESTKENIKEAETYRTGRLSESDLKTAEDKILEYDTKKNLNYYLINLLEKAGLKESGKNSLISSLKEGAVQDASHTVYMTDEEKEIYAYILKTKGEDAADDYLDYIEPEIEKRYDTEKIQPNIEKIEDISRKSAVAANLLNMLTPLGSVPAYVKTATAAIQNRFLPGEYAELRETDPMFRGVRYSEAISSGRLTDEAGKEKGGVSGILNQAALGISSSLGGALSGGLGIMAGGAAGSAAYNAVKEGSDPAEAAAYAAAQGIIEYATEKLPFEKMMKAFKAPKNTVKEFVVEAAKAGGINFLEESSNNILSNIADQIIRADRSEFAKRAKEYTTARINSGENEKDAAKAGAKDAFIDLYIKDTIISGIVGALSGTGQTALMGAAGDIRNTIRVYQRSGILDTAEKLGYNVEITDSKVLDGYVDSDTKTIYIRPGGKNPWKTILKHEISHIISESPKYQEMIDTVKRDMPREWDAIEKRVRARYDRINAALSELGLETFEVNDEIILQETTAELGEVLRNERYIRNFAVGENMPLAMKFLEFARDAGRDAKAKFQSTNGWDTAARLWGEALYDNVQAEKKANKISDDVDALIDAYGQDFEMSSKLAGEIVKMEEDIAKERQKTQQEMEQLNQTANYLRNEAEAARGERDRTNNILKIYEDETQKAFDFRSIADRLKKSTGTTVTSKKIAVALENAYDRLQESINNDKTRGTTGEKVYNDLYELAREMLNNAYITDSEMYDKYRDLITKLREDGISVPDSTKSDIGDYNIFRQRNFNRVKINNIGTPVDVYYQELNAIYPEIFPADIVKPTEQLLKIVKVRDQLDPKIIDDYTEEDVKDLRDRMFQELFTDEFDTEKFQSVAERLLDMVRAEEKEKYEAQNEYIEFLKNRSEESRVEKLNRQIQNAEPKETEESPLYEVTELESPYLNRLLAPDMKLERRTTETGKSVDVVTFKRTTREDLRRNETYQNLVQRIHAKGESGAYKDKGFVYDNIWRGARKFLGENDYRVFKALILDSLEDAKKNYLALQQFYTEKLNNEIVKGLGIKKDSDLSAAVQYYGEIIKGGNSISKYGPDAIRAQEIYNKLSDADKKKVQKAEEIFRQMYDGLIEAVNDSRRQIYPNAEKRIFEIERELKNIYHEINIIDLALLNGEFGELGDFSAIDRLDIKKVNKEELKLRLKKSAAERISRLEEIIRNKEKELSEVKNKESKKYQAIEDSISRNRQKIIETSEASKANEIELDKLISDLESKKGVKMEELKKKLNDRLQDLYKRQKDRIEELTNGDVSRGKLVKKRKDYFRHFGELVETEMGTAKEKTVTDYLNRIINRVGKSIHNVRNKGIDYRLVDVSKYTKPLSTWHSIFQKRKGEKTKFDAVGGFLDYLPQASYAIAIDPAISMFRGFREDLETPQSNADKNNDDSLGMFLSHLNRYATELSNKTDEIDRLVFDKGFMGRNKADLIKRGERRIKKAMVLFNINTMFAQGMNLPNGIAYINDPESLAKGLKDSVLDLMGNEEIQKRIGQSQFMQERYADFYSQFDHGIIANINKASRAMLEIFDKAATTFIWYSAYDKAIKKGEVQPIRYADDVTRRMVGGRGIGEMPSIYRSHLMGILLPFMYEPVNSSKIWGDIYLDYIAETEAKNNEILKAIAEGQQGVTQRRLSELEERINSGELKEEDVKILIDDAVNAAIEAGEIPSRDGIKNRSFAGAAKYIAPAMFMYIITAFAINALKEWITGSDGGIIDPMGEIVDGIRKDEGGGRIAANVAGNIASNTLGGQVLARVYPEYGFKIFNINFPSRKTIFGDNDPTRYGTGLFSSLDEPLWYGVGSLLGGGSQLKKTWQGIEALARGYGVDSKGNKTYEVERTPGNIIRAPLFGPNSLQSARDWYDYGGIKLDTDDAPGFTYGKKSKTVNITDSSGNKTSVKLTGPDLKDYEENRLKEYKKIYNDAARQNIQFTAKTTEEFKDELKDLENFLEDLIIQGDMATEKAQKIYADFKAGKKVSVTGVEWVTPIRIEKTVDYSKLTKLQKKEYYDKLNNDYKSGKIDKDEAIKQLEIIKNNKGDVKVKEYITGSIRALSPEDQKKIYSKMNSLATEKAKEKLSPKKELTKQQEKSVLDILKSFFLK